MITLEWRVRINEFELMLFDCAMDSLLSVGIGKCLQYFPARFHGSTSYLNICKQQDSLQLGLTFFDKNIFKNLHLLNWVNIASVYLDCCWLKFLTSKCVMKNYYNNAYLLCLKQLFQASLLVAKYPTISDYIVSRRTRLRLSALIESPIRSWY